MTYSALIGQYEQLRQKLEMAYAKKSWDSQQIDQIANEIVKTELALARSVTVRPRCTELAASPT